MSSRSFRVGLLTAGLLMGAGAWGKPQRTPAVPVGFAEPMITMHQAVAEAWARLPQRNSLAAQQNSAAARYLAGGAIVPNAPTAVVSDFNDRIAGSNYNYITTQVGVSTPVWLPGEGTATQNAAQAERVAIEAQAAMAHLVLAADVLRLATSATDAANTRAIAARRLATSRALAGDLSRQFAVGEAAQSDALAAEADAANAAVTLAQAESQLGAAKVTLAEVTGSPAIPALVVPAGIMPAGMVALPEGEHPQLRAAMEQVQAAQAQQRLVYLQDRDDPEIGLQGINEKQPGTQWDTRRDGDVPLCYRDAQRAAPDGGAGGGDERGGSARDGASPGRGGGGAEAGDAGRGRAGERCRRAGGGGAGEAAGQIERAWRLGEMPFIELVRANALAFDAESARENARTGRAAAALQLRIAQGALP